MKKSIPVLILLLGIGAAAAVLGVRYLSPPGPSDAVPAPAAGADAAVVTINGEAITQAEVDHHVALIAKQMGVPDSPEHQAQFKPMLEQRAVSALVSRDLLLQAAKREGIEAAAEEVDKEMTEMKANFPEPGAFEQKLQEFGLTEAVLRDQVKENLLIEQLLKKRAAEEAPVTDEEIKGFYEQHPDMVSQPETVSASHILIRFDEKDTPDTKAAKKKQLEDIRARAKAGEDFAALAKEFSQDPGSKDQGGELGSFDRERMVKPFADAAFALKVGGLSEVVETEFGYHLIKKTGAQPAKTPALDEVKEDIRQRLAQQRERGVVESYLKKLEAEAQIVYAPGKEPKAMPPMGGPHGMQGEASPH